MTFRTIKSSKNTSNSSELYDGEKLSNKKYYVNPYEGSFSKGNVTITTSGCTFVWLSACLTVNGYSEELKWDTETIGVLHNLKLD